MMSKRPVSNTKVSQHQSLDGSDSSSPKALEDSERGQLAQLRSQLDVANQSLKYAAREIHDNLGHLANLLHIHLTLLPETPLDQQASKIREINELVADMNREIKTLSIDLDASETMHISLDQQFITEINRLRNLGIFELVYTLPEVWPRFQPLKATVLLRMSQEILNNIIKHSAATLVKVEVFQSGTFLNIRLEDNGVGYDTGTHPEKPHLGMKHVYERAKAIKAQLHVNSQRGRGTIVDIRIPIP